MIRTIERASWEMVKVTDAANQIVKLPAVPSRVIIAIFFEFLIKVSEKSTTAAWDQTRYRLLR